MWAFLVVAMGVWRCLRVDKGGCHTFFHGMTTKEYAYEIHFQYAITIINSSSDSPRVEYLPIPR